MSHVLHDPPTNRANALIVKGNWDDGRKGRLRDKGEKSGNQKRSVYACPMHPEIVSDKPGNCSLCGMRLEKATQALAIRPTAVLDTGIRKHRLYRKR